MLTTILNLNKRVLVVDLPLGVRDFDYYELSPNSSQYVVQYIPNGSNIRTGFNLPKGSYQFLCKGEELTEEIAKKLVDSRNINYEDIYFDYKKDCWFDESMTAIDSFISAIEASGHYWLVNPYEDYKAQTIEHYKEWEKLFQEAESKTFKNPLIFEIL